MIIHDVLIMKIEHGLKSKALVFQNLFFLRRLEVFKLVNHFKSLNMVENPLQSAKLPHSIEGNIARNHLTHDLVTALYSDKHLIMTVTTCHY